MVGPFQMKQRCIPVPMLNVATNMVQSVISFRGTMDVLVDFREDSLHVDLVEITCCYKHSLCTCCCLGMAVSKQPKAVALLAL